LVLNSITMAMCMYYLMEIFLLKKAPDKWQLLASTHSRGTFSQALTVYIQLRGVMAFQCQLRNSKEVNLCLITTASRKFNIIGIFRSFLNYVLAGTAPSY